MNITPKSGKPVALEVSTPNDDLVVVTDKGMIIRTTLKNISLIGRDTQGVCIIKLNEGHKVASIAVVDALEDK
jgi:DNA gyrase subunit A